MREGFYENETLEERLFRMADEWEKLASRETCQCEDTARDKCAEDLRHAIKQAAQQSVKPTKAIRCACGGEMLANYRCQSCGLASPL